MRKLSDLPEEMVLDDQVKQRILRNGRTIAQKRRKQARLRNGILVGAVVIASIVFPLSNDSHISNERGLLPLTVYAKDVSGKEVLDIGSGRVFSLTRTETPLGEGYTLQMVAKEGYHYELNIEDMGTGLETIFIRDNDVYWIPEYWKDSSGKLYDTDGSELMISNALSSPILNYCVYNQENRLCTELSIQLHEEETGSAELIRLVCYPEENGIELQNR